MPRTTRTRPHGRRAACLAALALALLPAAADARLGDLDPSFDGDGQNVVSFGPLYDSVFEGVVTRPDGRVVAVGWRDDGTNQEVIAAQFDATGAFARPFGAGGVSIVPLGGFARRAYGVALAGSGRVLAAGDQRATTAPPGRRTRCCSSSVRTDRWPTSTRSARRSARPTRCSRSPTGGFSWRASN